MASLSAEAKVEFLLTLLASSEFTPNYAIVAQKMGINTKANAQRRFKVIVKPMSDSFCKATRRAAPKSSIYVTETTMGTRPQSRH